jgi:hypothetical protein
MAKKKSASKPETISERDEIAVQVASGLCHLCSQGNMVNYELVAERAYGIADALLAYRNK